jgi:glycerol kinase
VLPAVVPTSGVLAEADLLGARVPIAALAGDQQAALFGQACFAPGQAKATYGTGSFVLANVGDDPGAARDGLVQTVAWRLGEGPAAYALEGSIFVTGAAIRWLRDGLGLLADARESDALARSVDGTNGVYFVPALAGLGSPHWAPEARGLVTGLHLGTRREHVVRAALEAIAYQVTDVLEAVGGGLELLRADGGAADNAFLLQFQADVARVPVEVPVEREATALGAAALAGLAVGIWSGPTDVAAARAIEARYEPALDADEAARLLAGWREAVSLALRPR